MKITALTLTALVLLSVAAAAAPPEPQPEGTHQPSIETQGEVTLEDLLLPEPENRLCTEAGGCTGCLTPAWLCDCYCQVDFIYCMEACGDPPPTWCELYCEQTAEDCSDSCFSG